MRRPRGTIDPDAVSVKGMGAMLTPAQIAASGSEHAHQAAVMQWVATSGAMQRWPSLWLLHAIPNGGDRTQSVGANLKAEGVKSGVPDLFLPVPLVAIGARGSGGARWYHGLYIEMKKPGMESRARGDRSEKQVKWHLELLEQGYAVATCYGWQTATWVLWVYLEGKLCMPAEDCLMALPCSDPPNVPSVT